MKYYRKPLDFSLENLEAAKSSYKRLKNIILEIKKSIQKKNDKNIEIAKKQFLEIINDDLNMPKAISFLWEVLREKKLNDAEKYELALDFDKVFGLNLNREEKIEIPKEVAKLIKEREEMRKKKNWQEADNIRNRIKKLGYQIDDTEEGVRVRKL